MFKQNIKSGINVHLEVFIFHPYYFGLTL